MNKIIVAMLTAVLLLSVVGCNKTPPDVPDNTDKDKENKSVEEQLLSYDSYDVFENEIYLCDDVYRSDDTPTHGTGYCTPYGTGRFRSQRLRYSPLR